MKRQGADGHLHAEGTGLGQTLPRGLGRTCPAHTLILGSQPPELQEMNVCGLNHLVCSGQQPETPIQVTFKAGLQRT